MDISNGLIICWGTSLGDRVVNFPTSFGDVNYNINATMGCETYENAAPYAPNIVLNQKTISSCRISSYESNRINYLIFGV